MTQATENKLSTLKFNDKPKLVFAIQTGYIYPVNCGIKRSFIAVFIKPSG